MIRAAVAVAVAVGAGLGVAPAPAAVPVPQDLPPRSIRHQNSQYWSWSGPRSWVSADGAYGIRITSGNGQLDLDYGFSSIVCATGNTVDESVANYFAQQRAALTQSVSSNWRRAKVKASQIVALPQSSYGPLYYRQTYRISGRESGTRFAGEIQQDYSLASGPTYCFARNEARTAPRKGYRTAIRQLRSVQASLAYFGPGAGEGVTDPTA